MDEATVHVPEFPAKLVWINTPGPLRFHQELRGQVVVLDFWTYCCINCMHVLPDLAYLEKKYGPDPVAFIGVHSPKYTNEERPDNVRQAVLRYGITHPVVVDAQHLVWDSFGIHAWPTLVVVDSTGHAVAALPGEGHRDELDRLIAGLLDIGRQQGTLAEKPIPRVPARREISYSGLAYPEKVLADPDGGRLFIADTDHHRVLLTDWNGAVLGFLGSGSAGLRDGAYEDARFDTPQGMALVGGALYIADTRNHALRRADLTTFHVDTVGGNGMIGYDRHGGHRGREQVLNSPWDVTVLNGVLYIAMAGLHQIWTYDLKRETLQAVIGTGRENLADNEARRAALAQPSGLTAENGVLYFADSETSAVRQFDPRSGQVTTLAGKGLFTFGDVDGAGDAALLQHPLGVAAQGHDLFVADTYNHKIRRIDLRTGQVSTLIGTGAPGREDGAKPALYEPGGLAVAGNDLFIADTNNQRILRYRLDTGVWHEVVPTIGGMALGEAA